MNFKTPISTTREQSERLLALGLKPETADMYIDKHGIPVCLPYSRLDGHQDQPSLRPAWSLSRLLEMIPSNIEDDYCSAGLQITPPVISYYNYLDEESYMLFNRVSIFDNAIECIGWLIINNHFNKEYLIEKDNEL